jgi:hypothetical protein
VPSWADCFLMGQGRQPACCSPHHAGERVETLLRPLIQKGFTATFSGASPHCRALAFGGLRHDSRRRLGGADPQPSVGQRQRFARRHHHSVCDHCPNSRVAIIRAHRRASEPGVFAGRIIAITNPGVQGAASLLSSITSHRSLSVPVRPGGQGQSEYLRYQAPAGLDPAVAGFPDRWPRPHGPRQWRP